MTIEGYSKKQFCTAVRRKINCKRRGQKFAFSPQLFGGAIIMFDGIEFLTIHDGAYGQKQLLSELDTYIKTGTYQLSLKM